MDKAIDSMRERFAVYEAHKGKTKDGDQVVIDFKGTIDGEEFPGGAADNYPYILGSKRFFAEFEEALTGVKAGAEVECKVEFPEDYHGKDVAGKTAEFAIKVNEVKRKQLPEIDDDFASEAGFENIAEMREQVAKELSDGASQQGQRAIEAQATEQLVKASKFELPASLVDSSANEYYQQEVRRLMELRIPASEIEKQSEKLLEAARQNALDGIKAFVVINEVGVKEEITVTEEDFEAEAANIQERTGMEKQVIQRFLSQADQRSEYEGRIYRQKSMKAVLDAAKITEKEVTAEELNEQDVDTDEA